MAQTKRKRQTKHRGNAAGVVESRGRTGRKPTAAEKSGNAQKAKAQAVDRRDRPPTWRAAFIKGMFAAVVLLLFVIFFTPKSGSLVALFPIVLVMYTVISYYTDRWVYARRQRNKAKRAAAGKAPSR
jgi:protein-S-isoprenylcysteine O-methyltransferase Ste14